MKQQTSVQLVVLMAILLLIAIVAYFIPEPLGFDYKVLNIAFIVLFAYSTLTLFTYKFSFLAKGKIPLKVVLIVLSVPFVFYLVTEVHGVQSDVDSYGVEHLLKHMTEEKPSGWLHKKGQFVFQQLLFFGVGSVITVAALSLRHMISIWRNINRGTV